MGETRFLPCALVPFVAKNFANYGNGRVREDAVGVIFLARVSNPVRAPFTLTNISDPARFKHAVYVDASTLPSIETDLQTWARELGDGHEHDTWEDAVRILTKVPEDEQWGLILDNADDPTLNLVPIIPKSKNLTVVITSRNRNLANLSTIHHMEMGEMQLAEALATLLLAARRQLPLSYDELESAHTIVKELGCLAVALVQAGTYCHELSCSFTQYLKLFYSHRAELLRRAEPSSLDNYQRGAYTALDLSYKALPQPCRDFLHFISFFHHTDIPLAALATAAREDFEDKFLILARPATHERVHADLRRLLCVEGKWSEMQVQETLRTLRTFSLISISSINDSIFLQLHPLIQSWSRDMVPFNSQQYRAMTLQVLATCCRDDAFLLHRYLLPHIPHMLDQLKGRVIHINDLIATGIILNGQGYYDAAAELFKAGLAAMGKSAEIDEETIAEISERLAGAYWAQGRWDEAERLVLDVLQQRRKVLGVEHLNTIKAAAKLAATYHAQGRYNEAEELRADVLEKRRRVLGRDNPDTIKAAANLAAIHHTQGRYNEAERLEVEVLEKRRRVLGMEHPETIRAAANLAVTYYSQGRWSEAETLQVEVLERRRRMLGMEHPDTISTGANLAVTYWAQGRQIEAKKLEMGVLKQRARVLGMEHPDTIRAAVNLAVTYGRQSRWEESVSLLAPAVRLSLHVLGQQHPHTQDRLRDLVQVYGKLGKEKEAQETRNLLIP
jgi:tetratricopeptide (TPR) repeat protein